VTLAVDARLLDSLRLRFALKLHIGEAILKGDEKVIAELNAALLAELTAIVQYMVQSELCDNWGYKRLAQRHKERAFQEMHHAETAIERIIFLDGMPKIDVGLTPKVGENVQQQLEIDLADEIDASRQYNASVRVCRDAGDTGTREIFEHMIQDEEGHVDFLEAQLHTIKEMGIGNYLSEQLKEGEKK
jgi:bacterioferritin